MKQDNNFKKDVLWDLGNRLLKLDQKYDKNGKLYLIGDFGYNFKVTVREMGGQFNQGKWELKLYPIKYTKIENAPQPPQNETIVEAKKIFNAEEVDGDSVPF